MKNSTNILPRIFEECPASSSATQLMRFNFFPRVSFIYTFFNCTFLKNILLQIYKRCCNAKFYLHKSCTFFNLKILYMFFAVIEEVFYINWISELGKQHFDMAAYLDHQTLILESKWLYNVDYSFSCFLFHFNECPGVKNIRGILHILSVLAD